ncbi:hypothetical protein [Bradyrhizobium centrosematis]|uniref:hypothetical protein n=1 Tax=Bradyrhizobium centrosematis TaxID=1300039 RepID=UPI00388EA940
MSAVLPVIACLLLINSSFGSVVRIYTGRRVFYALRKPSVFPEAVMLCPILLQAGARFHKRTMGGRRVVEALNGGRGKASKFFENAREKQFVTMVWRADGHVSF